MPSFLSSAKRYAKALFELAQEQNCLEEVYGDLKSLAELISSSVPLRNFFLNLMVPKFKRSQILAELFQKRIHPRTYQFLQFLNEKSKLMILKEIPLTFEKLYLEDKGVLSAMITSSGPLEEGQINAISQRLKTKLNCSLAAETVVDESLIAGFKVKVADTVYDFSLKTHLEKFKRNVMAA